MHNTATDRNRHCARSIANFEFVEQVFQMSVHRLVADPEDLGDFFVSLSVGDQLEDLLFTSGERRF